MNEYSADINKFEEKLKKEQLDEDESSQAGEIPEIEGVVVSEIGEVEIAQEN